MDVAAALLLAIVLVALLVVMIGRVVQRITVFEYERGLKYERGRFTGVLEPGQYWIVRSKTAIKRVDIRPRVVTISGQEVLSSDGVSVKVSLAANFAIVEPDLAINKHGNYQESLYLQLQLAAREILGGVDVETMLANRGELSNRLLESGRPQAEALGLELIDAGVKDIMFPGKLKDLFAQVLAAKQEGLAALERARGESAALRNLANAARMLDDNPNLVQLRVLQAIGETSGNTVVLGVPGLPPQLSKSTRKSAES